MRRTDLFITCYLGKTLCGFEALVVVRSLLASPFSIIKAGLACSLTLLSSRTRWGVI